MINVTINGITKQFEEAASVSDIIEAFGDEAAQFTCAVNIDGKMFDLDHLVKKDCEITLLTFRDIKEQRDTVDEGGKAAAKDEEQDEAPIVPDDSEMDIFDGLNIESVFSQDAFDAIESEIKSMVSGDFDGVGMTFEPRRALELLESVADGALMSAEEKEAVSEAVTEAVYGVNEALTATADDADTADGAAEESAEASEQVSEEPVEAAETSPAEAVGDVSEAEEGSGEVLEISEAQIDAIVEMAAAEAALNAENIDDLCDELISGIDESDEPTLSENIALDGAAAEHAVDDVLKGVAGLGEENEESFAVSPEETARPVSADVAPVYHKKSNKKGKKAASNLIKAAAILIAVASLGWFGGRAAIRAIGAQDVKGAHIISRSDAVSKTDANAENNVSASDIVPVYNAAQLTFGSANDLVIAVQNRLNALGYLADAHLNGTYDKNTENAVQNFRSDNHIDKSGYIDSETFALLFSDKATAEPSETDAAEVEETTEAAATALSTVPGTTTTTASTTTTAKSTTSTTAKTTTTTGRTTTTRRTTTTTGRTTTTTGRTTTTTRRTTTTTRRTTTTTRRTTTTTTTGRTTTTTRRTTTRNRTTTTTTRTTTNDITEPTSVTTTTAAPTSATTTTAAPAPTTVTTTTAAPTPAPTTGGNAGEDIPAVG